ncbi:MAG: glycoside hydrolase family 140 protein [Acidobacteria bacterium]|nr:glycoside hydrolase family 140 protein [Acidobacteriota bacterium]
MITLLLVGWMSLFAADTGRIAVSANGRYLQHADGKPFFWLADTAWLLFQKLNKEQTEQYLENRRANGFNVIQAVVLSFGPVENAYGAKPFLDGDPSRPAVTGGYDYWDHIDWVVDRAAAKGMYIAIVPAWGSVIKRGVINEKNAAGYARFLAGRYRARPNVFWMNGGDLQGDVQGATWQALGRTLREADPNHLITFHPFGRTQSSTWFHDAAWLDFNLFQSGHRRYDQDSTAGAKGEDNWRYVFEDWARKPAKPTIDGEPSYEEIPQGLHDPKQPRWKDHDVRRYAYWSVFAGAAGHTYGHNAVMQFRKKGEAASYGSNVTWQEGIDFPGAGQMQHLKKLMLSRPYFERVNDDGAVVEGNGPRYERVTATRGRGYLLVYSYLGKPFAVRGGAIAGKQLRASWFDPRSGKQTEIGLMQNTGTLRFTPPSAGVGNDWVLILDEAAR